MEISKQLLYIIIFIKMLFLTMFLYYKIAYYSSNYDEAKLNKIKEKTEVLHESFAFFTYILLVLLFNPYNKNIILHKNQIDSRHFQLVIFLLGIIQLFNFDYNIFLKIPELML